MQTDNNFVNSVLRQAAQCAIADIQRNEMRFFMPFMSWRLWLRTRVKPELPDKWTWNNELLKRVINK